MAGRDRELLTYRSVSGSRSFSVLLVYRGRIMIDFAGIDIQLESVVDLLKRELTLHTVCRQLIHQTIIRANAQERGLDITDDEVQTEADRTRRELQLERALLHQYERSTVILASPSVEGPLSISRHSYPA